MIKRALSAKLIEIVKKYPVITLTGPRQSGKTTLLRNIFPDYRYISLEDPDEHMYAEEDTRGFLSQFSDSVILDEVQQTPDLFSYIQTMVDADDTPGRFILSGSQNFLLSSGISQSLAGRTAILHLLPFTRRELGRRPSLSIDSLPDEPAISLSTDLFTAMFTGFYPRIHDKHLDPQEWLVDYFQTYIQRDVRSIVNIGDIHRFSRFVRLCAGRTGQLLNLSSLGTDCGISHSTAQRWLSLLENSFIVFRLMPHFKNFSKRLIKSPKLYFYDSGLLCYLLKIKSPDALRYSPYRGPVFESFCIAEFMKSAWHRKEEPDIFFWRDSTGHEIDMLIDQGDHLFPCEIKSGETFSSSFTEGMQHWLELSGEKRDCATVLFGGSQKRVFRGIRVLPWSVL